MMNAVTGYRDGVPLDTRLVKANWRDGIAVQNTDASNSALCGLQPGSAIRQRIIHNTKLWRGPQS